MTPAAGDIRLSGGSACFLGRRFVCSVGSGGIRGDKREGDGATPAGVFGLLHILFRPDRIDGARLPGARPLRRGDIWSDDPRDPGYNRFVPSAGAYPWSHERLWRADNLYDLIIPVAYNWHDPRPGAGSAIFIHRWRGSQQPTEGCVAFAPDDLVWIARRITQRTRLAVRPSASCTASQRGRGPKTADPTRT